MAAHRPSVPVWRPSTCSGPSGTPQTSRSAGPHARDHLWSGAQRWATPRYSISKSYLGPQLSISSVSLFPPFFLSFGSMPDGMPRTVATSLRSVGLQSGALADCVDLAEEWSVIKRAYFKTALKTHPDKGGDAAAFREARAAFQSLRALFDGAAPTFRFSAAQDTSTEQGFASFDPSANTPSWEFYAEAAQEPVPKYRVERARSGRSRCQAKGSAKFCAHEEIEKDSLRVGWMNSETGAYGGWVHLSCWRVPNRVWLGLPNPHTCEDVRVFVAALISMGAVLLSGLTELTGSEMRAVARYCMNRQNWARAVALKKEPTTALATPAGVASTTSASPSAGTASVKPSKALLPSSATASSSTAMAASRRFQFPVAGRDGRPHALAGKTVVLSGVYPEVGGGTGLSLGKEKVKAFVEAFGGRVTSAVSGKVRTPLGAVRTLTAHVRTLTAHVLTLTAHVRTLTAHVLTLTAPMHIHTAHAPPTHPPPCGGGGRHACADRRAARRQGARLRQGLSGTGAGLRTTLSRRRAPGRARARLHRRRDARPSAAPSGD